MDIKKTMKRIVVYYFLSIGVLVNIIFAFGVIAGVTS